MTGRATVFALMLALPLAGQSTAIDSTFFHGLPIKPIDGVFAAGLSLLSAPLISFPATSSISWTSVPSDGPSTIKGIVTGAKSVPIPHAIVTLGVDSDELRVQADSTGLFEVAVPGAGSYTVRVDQLGFLQASDSIEIGQGERVFLVAELAGSRHACEWESVLGETVAVHLYPTFPGQEPPVSATIEVEGRSGKWSMEASQFPRPDGLPYHLLTFQPAATDLGPFRIQVRAEGYADWERADVFIGWGLCARDPYAIRLLPHG